MNKENPSNPIGRAEISRKQREILLNASTLDEGVREFIAWLGRSEPLLDQEAKEYSDNFFDQLFKTAAENAGAMPESPEKRQALRMAKTGLGEHHRSIDLLEGLETSPDKFEEIDRAWNQAALSSVQCCLDFLFDVVQVKSQGNYRIVFLGLFYNCIDELTSAQMLSRHTYFIQSNTHLRSVIETLDKAELFLQDTKWIALWAGDDDRKIWRELKPAEIRKKLGKEKHDPIYSYLSSIGTHPSFRMFQSRALREASDREVGNARAFLAGTPLEHLRLTNYLTFLVVSNLTLSRIVATCADVLNEAEVMAVIKKQADAFGGFVTDQFLSMKKTGDERFKELEEILRSLV